MYSPERKAQFGADRDAGHAFDSLIEREDIDTTLVNKERRVRLEDIVFGHILCKDLEEELVNELSDSGVADAVVADLRDAVLRLPVEDRKKILAWPKELRVRDDETLVYGRQVAELKETGDVGAFIKALLAISNRSDTQWTIGYHVSRRDIRPTEDGVWNVIGFEKDHRDNDLPKAYYSLTYEDLYRGKDGADFLYMVRASYNDLNDGRWYRNSVIPIVHKVYLPDIMRQVQDYIAGMKIG